MLKQEVWKSLYDDNDDDVNKSFKIFYNKYLEIFNSAFPIKRISIEKKKGINHKQISSIVQLKEILDLILILSEYNFTLKDVYKEVKKQYDRELVAQKSKLYDQKISSSDKKKQNTLVNSKIFK